jgi:hypothetical protein
MNNIALKFPPTKAVSVPDRLIYKAGDLYRMCSIKSGKILGTMTARPSFITQSHIYPKMKDVWAYYVAGLSANVKEQGVGKDFEKFLRKLSKNDERCEGRIFLRAFNNIDSSHRASSTWWYARGYRGCNKDANADLERVIRKQKTKYGSWYMDMDMYLPPENIK